MTTPNPTPHKKSLIVLGLDENKTPLAGVFPADQRDLVEKAAAALKLVWLAVEGPELLKVSAELPEGKILAAGKAAVPSIKPGLYERLLAAIPKSQKPKGLCLPQPPASWRDVAPGHHVLVLDNQGSDGWYEAVVLEQAGPEAFKLRFRDYPEEGVIVRQRNQLGLMPRA